MRRLAVALGDAFDLGETVVPAGEDPRHPSGGLVEAFFADRVSDLASGAGRFDESGSLEDREVLGDALASDRQISGECGCGGLARCEEAIEQLFAGWVGDRGPEPVGLRILAGHEPSR